MIRTFSLTEPLIMGLAGRCTRTSRRPSAVHTGLLGRRSEEPSHRLCIAASLRLTRTSVAICRCNLLVVLVTGLSAGNLIASIWLRSAHGLRPVYMHCALLLRSTLCSRDSCVMQLRARLPVPKLNQ